MSSRRPGVWLMVLFHLASDINTVEYRQHSNEHVRGGSGFYLNVNGTDPNTEPCGTPLTRMSWNR